MGGCRARTGDAGGGSSGRLGVAAEQLVIGESKNNRLLYSNSQNLAPFGCCELQYDGPMGDCDSSFRILYRHIAKLRFWPNQPKFKKE